MSDILARAADFIWRNARLLDRQRFAFHFENGSRQDVVHGLLAYQNGDGGFGAALEPDLRDPSSQPVPAQHALEVLDEVGFDETKGYVQKVMSNYRVYRELYTPDLIRK